MNTESPVMRDERTVSVENAGYRWAYLVLSIGLLVATAYRAYTRGDEAWDLLGLVVLGGLVATLYQGAHRVLTRRWALVTVGAMVAAAAVAVVLVALLAARH